MIASLRYGRNSIGIDIDSEYCRMAARYLKKESSNLFLNTELIFRKMIPDNTGQMKICEDQALYKVKSARKTIE
jgi:site-specific DNA-methyltransferase (adenine-specific)